MKIYRFKHIYFCQDELTFGEDMKIKDVIVKLAEVVGTGNKTLAESIGGIIDANILTDLFAIILKPYHPTVFHRLWNYLWLKWYGIQPKDIIHTMRNSEVMAVLGDFFVFNTAWMKGLEGTENPLTSVLSGMKTPSS